MLLWHARVWRESLSGHHFDYRLSTAVDVGQCLSSLLKLHALPGGGEKVSIATKRAKWANTL